MDDTQLIYIDINEYNDGQIIYATQNHYGYKLMFIITKDGEQINIDNMKFDFKFIKDKQILPIPCELIVNNIVFTITKETTDADGRFPFQLFLKFDDSEDITIEYVFNVRKDGEK